MVKDPAVSVNRCMWSPDGNLLGKETLSISKQKVCS